MIKIENLGKRYEDKWGMRGLNLEIPEGEILAFIGPNGAGKTTTIKLITGLLKPTEGRAVLHGFDTQVDATEARRQIGYIPDRPYLYEKLSGRDYMKFIADLFEISDEKRNDAIDYYFKLFNLTHATDQLIENYSHGMRQKLIFSATFMHDPSVYIIDEPLVGLDPKSIRLVKNLFQEAAARGKTIFLSTHTLSVAEELAHRIAVVNGGKMLFLGTLKALSEELKNSGNLEELFLQITEDAVEPDTAAEVRDVI